MKAGISHQVAHLIDLMPTFTELAGATYPKKRAGNSVPPMEGKSLVPLFHGDSLGPRTLFWEHEGNRAVRAGDWKLVALNGSPWELYDMSRDRTETTDLTAKSPQKAAELRAQWDRWAARANVLPWAEVQKRMAENRPRQQDAKPTLPAVAAAASASRPETRLQVDDLCVHDPFILADTKTCTYYLYGGYNPVRDGAMVQSPHGRAGVMVYQSQDLVHWTQRQIVFEIPENFWADADSSPWAPEVHAYNDRYYLFTTFNAWKEKLEDRPGRPFLNKRASQILVADSPLGPFQPFANKPHTPPGEMTLDATFWFEDGQPWMIYCHEWVQLGNGLIKSVRLKPDLSETVGEPITLLNAGDFDWTRKQIGYKGGQWPGAVTDGPELLRLSNGTLAMLWSSHTPEHQYAQAIAYSPSGKLAGPWKHEPQPLLWDERGHGMIFRALQPRGELHQPWDGKLLLVLHRYFQMPRTRVQIFAVEDLGDRIQVGKQILGAP